MAEKDVVISTIDLDYKMRDERKMAYAYMRKLEDERDERHKREAAWDAKHRLGPIARWAIGKVRGFHDSLDEEEIQEALEMANPMAGFQRWKEVNRKDSV